MSQKPEPSETQEVSNQEKAEKIVKSALIERKQKDLAKSGGKTLLDKYAEIFKIVEEQQFAPKKLEKGEIVIGTILEASIRNSINYPDNYQMMIKAINVYKINPYTGEDVADSEMVIEERREILYIAKAGCTQILRQLKVQEPEKGYDLKELSENKTILNKLKGRKYSIKYMGVQEYNGHNFHSYVVNLL